MEEIETEEWEELKWEPSVQDAQSACMQDGHMPARAFADNGFTYALFCMRCGADL